MKQILTVIFILLISANIGFAQKSKNKKMLLGSWQMSVGKNPSINNTAILVFRKDGSLEITEMGRAKKRINWSLSEDGKTINLTGVERISSSIVSLDNKTMQLQLDKDGDIGDFIRLAKKPAVKLKGLNKDIAGTWKDDKSGMMLIFYPDGIASNFRASETAQWKVSADGKQLLLMNVNDQEEVINIDMAKDKKSFKMTVKDDIITFVRSKEKFIPVNKKEKVTIISVEEEKSNIKELEIIGNWKVTEIDKEILEGRSLMIELKSDKTFKVTENGTEERSGKWELLNGRVYLNDVQNNNTDYSVVKDPDGNLLLNDYYGTLKLKRQ